MISRSNLTPDFLYKSTLFFSLIILLVSSWNAPMSGDEYVHVKQAEKNINYIKSLGKDKQALETPISRLKHYGQSYDTVTTFLAQVFSINEQLYRFRHVSNAIIAWLTILFASFVTIKITKSKVAAFITIVLFLISLRFMGHAMNNLKDIPFAFAFIFSIYFLLIFLEKLPKISWIDLGLMTQGLAFGTSIRIGGVLIFAYYILFTGLYIYFQAVSGRFDITSVIKVAWKVCLLFIAVFTLAYVSAILIWPWALENPIKNPWLSFDLMHQYPTTVRQIFEGKLYWSDRFPWYYLFKYLLITLPLVSLAGFAASLFFIWKLKEGKNILFSLFVLIAFGFPVFYAAVSGANVYGGWRQMLFVYPFFIVASSVGLWKAWEAVGENRVLKLTGSLLILPFLYSPISYFISNYPYQYTFFNQLAGGLNDAYGKYEIDYYFTSYKKAYEFIDHEIEDQPEIVAANFIIPEYYKGKKYKPKLVDYYDRSSIDWDYAVICNTFLDPYQLTHEYWPPANTVYREDIDGVPIVVVLKRESKIDLQGKQALDRKEFDVAIEKLELALTGDIANESIRLNLARAYLLSGDFTNTSSTLNYFDTIYPSNEWANELRGEIAMHNRNIEEAVQLFRNNVTYNHKFFHSYINLAKAYIFQGNQAEAISQLKTCLRINPFYEPAYKLYGKLLIEQGNIELGKEMLEYSNKGKGKYGRK